MQELQLDLHLLAYDLPKSRDVRRERVTYADDEDWIFKETLGFLVLVKFEQLQRYKRRFVMWMVPQSLRL